MDMTFAPAPMSRMMKSSAVALVTFIATACGSSAGDETGSPANPEASPSSEATSPLVGLWQRDNTCQEIVAGLEEAGLPLAIAPGLIADNGYVSGSVEQLAKKDDPCEGAIARAHAHFFSADGKFGSLDWNYQQSR
jgi:hypothetical protein